MQSTAVMAATAGAASVENFPSLFEPWSYNCWTSDAFARDTETLTRALQASLSQESHHHYSSSSPSPSPSPAVTPTAAFKPDAVFSDSDSGPRLASQAPSRLPGAGGKISKRKTRASKKSPTTFITADPANFREMVQQVTGVRFAGGGGETGVAAGLEYSSRVLMRPEPQRLGAARAAAAAGVAQNCFLPTLDTSAFLLDREFQAGSSVAPAEPVTGGGGGGGVFGLEQQPFSCFPTLESWGVM